MPDEFNIDETYKPVPKEQADAFYNSLQRGFRSEFTGMRQDSKGNMFREFTVKSDDFDTSQSRQQSERYMLWHQMNHRSAADPQCHICKSQAEFKRLHPELVGKRVDGPPPCKNCGRGFSEHIGGQCP